MKRRLRYLLCLLPLLISCEAPTTGLVIQPPSTHPTTPTTPGDNGSGGGGGDNGQDTPPARQDLQGTFVVGYATYWDSVLPDPTLLTHINYAFAHIKSDFESLDIKEESRLSKIAALKNTNPKLKVLLSVGGWGAGNFSEMAASETHRKAFAKNCLAAVNKYRLDGIDIDWEYPTSSDAGISSSPNDKANFTLMLKELRSILGSSKLITMASASNADYIDWTSAMPYLDFVNLMTYDMGKPPYHNASLYRSPTMTKSGDSHSCEGSVKLHHDKGVPYDRIVLGIPFFGHNGDKEVYFNRIDYSGYNNLSIRWDDAAKVPYLVDDTGAMVLTYDNEESVRLKAEYAKRIGLRGAMYWNLEADYADWSLSKSIAGVLLGWTEPAKTGFLATNPYVQRYLEAVDYGSSDYTYSSICAFEGGGPGENDIPPSYTISWTASSAAQKLVLSEGSWSRTYEIAAGTGQLDVSNLVPGTTYQWKVTQASGNATVASGSFATRGLLRQVYFEPNGRNGRDLGGWKGLGGKTLAYHKLFRGGAIHDSRTSSKGKAEMRAEGIKAEVDLREASSVPSKSPLGDDIAFFAPGFEGGYNDMIRDNPDKVRETFLFVVQCLREGKPVYFHCAAGRDRTGTLAVLLEGALGVSESDMAKDYELTYFSPEDWSMYKGRYQHTRNNYSYSSIRKTIFAQTDSGTYQERIVKYLLKIGVAQKDIDDLRAVMLK